MIELTNNNDLIYLKSKFYKQIVKGFQAEIKLRSILRIEEFTNEVLIPLLNNSEVFNYLALFNIDKILCNNSCAFRITKQNITLKIGKTLRDSSKYRLELAFRFCKMRDWQNENTQDLLSFNQLITAIKKVKEMEIKND